jgi:hypothetical protein
VSFDCSVLWGFMRSDSIGKNKKSRLRIHQQMCVIVQFRCIAHWSETRRKSRRVGRHRRRRLHPSSEQVESETEPRGEEWKRRGREKGKETHSGRADRR